MADRKREANPRSNSPDAPSSSQNGAQPPEQHAPSRLERLKKKIKKLQGNNPDIYPLW